MAKHYAAAPRCKWCILSPGTWLQALRPGGRLRLAWWRPTPLHLVRGKGDPFGDPSTKVEQNQPVYLCFPDSLMPFKDAEGWIRGRDAVDRRKVLCTEHHRHQVRATTGPRNPVGSGHGLGLKA
eukprot:scaffold113_cov339-Pavlova_lutheri.AAC.43